MGEYQIVISLNASGDIENIYRRRKEKDKYFACDVRQNELERVF